MSFIDIIVANLKIKNTLEILIMFLNASIFLLLVDHIIGVVIRNLFLRIVIILL